MTNNPEPDEASRCSVFPDDTIGPMRVAACAVSMFMVLVLAALAAAVLLLVVAG